jgi:hypothetical protein
MRVCLIRSHDAQHKQIKGQRRFAPMMNQCRITPSAYPAYETGILYRFGKQKESQLAQQGAVVRYQHHRTCIVLERNSCPMDATVVLINP